MKGLAIALMALAAGLVVMGGFTAAAAPPNPKKTTICHWTGKNYVKVSVGARALRGTCTTGVT